MIFLLRHGQTEMNLQSRLQGRSDAPLTPAGRDFANKMAAMLGERIGQRRAVIHSSPLGRAVETARIIADGLGCSSDPILDDRLAELDLGAWDGLTMAEIDNGWPEARQDTPAGEWFFRAPGGEDFETFRERIASFLGDLPGAGSEPLVFVSHGLSGRIVRGLHAGLGREEMVSLPVPGDAFFALGEGGVIEELKVV